MTKVSFRGAVTDTYEYDAFGNKINSTGTTPNNMLYRGEMYDSDLGLYYLRARYMNPLTGRFMSRDPNDPQLLDSDRVPVDPKKLHKYLYADGDPMNMLDPTGHEAAEEEAGADFQSIFQSAMRTRCTRRTFLRLNALRWACRLSSTKCSIKLSQSQFLGHWTRLACFSPFDLREMEIRL